MNSKWIIACSSRGTVLKELIKRCPDSIAGILTDRPCGAQDLAFALNIRHYSFEQWEQLPLSSPILLLGFKRILKSRHLANRPTILNIHPSFLPLHPGWDESVHEAVLKSGQKLSAVTLHRVDESIDGGEILYQFPIPILPADTVGDLKARCQEAETFICQLLLNNEIENLPKQLCNILIQLVST